MRSFLAILLLLSLCFCGCATGPMLMVSTPEESKEYNAGYTQGTLDAQGSAAWSLAGFGCGIFGIGAAYIYSATPPPQVLAGKSQEYTVAYIEAYQSKSRQKNAHHAMMGMVVSIAAYLLLIAMDY